jgi:hypothetical protein
VTHGLGYGRVDDDPNVPVLLATMDATAGWEATRSLRSWERDQLGMVGGERLLDVGCGLGERFTEGDACSLDEPDDSFDAVRSERTLQWLADESPAPDGCFSMESLADDLVATHHLASIDRRRFLATIHDAARRGAFSMRLTMFAVVAAAPQAASGPTTPRGRGQG